MDSAHLKSLLNLNNEVTNNIIKNPHGKLLFDEFVESMEECFSCAWKTKEELKEAFIKHAAIAIRISAVGNLGDNKCLKEVIELADKNQQF